MKVSSVAAHAARDFSFLSLALLLVSCGGAEPSGGAPDAEGEPPTTDLELPAGAEAFSLLGEPLYSQPDTGSAIAEADARLAEAPLSLELLLEAARVRAPSLRFREAIDLYDRAVQHHGDDWRPYRFRGHRYISTRQIPLAIRDLERARELAPLSFDVAYHLGLAYYLAGRFDDAADEYGRCLALAEDPEALARARSGELGEDFRACMEIATRDDSRVAVTDWRYRALRRAGRHVEAASLLSSISARMDVEANTAYYHCLLFYQGQMDEAAILAEDNPAGYRLETVGYGIATWHLVEGNEERAVELLEEVAAHPHWSGFGRIAAEADLASMREGQGSSPSGS